MTDTIFTHVPFMDHPDASSSMEDASVIIISAPMEATVSYGSGTCNGPAAILGASSQVELYDMDLGYCPHEVGIHTLDPLPIVQGESPEKSINTIRNAVKMVVSQGKKPFVLGGEHSVTYGALLGYLDGIGRESADSSSFGILQFDAHSDLRDHYEDNPLSHACVMRRALDLGFKVTGVGIRSMSPEEASELEALEERGVTHFTAAHAAGLLHLNRLHGSDEIQLLQIIKSLPTNVWLTFDIDALDPSIIRQTGTPEPGGLIWYDVMAVLKALARNGNNVVGMDLVEFAPRGNEHADAFTCARLVQKMIGLIWSPQE
ncbi:MAG: agmatinase [Candidatus Wallbacteria bacterium HGW-Wallbacteria-1]|jgi:agmatinase|uniref:Agmatinase n=1 Tax=Candidatus Wallbacteria bacterium HGW-Wallbacteria-1 TaxID=2013854 RepID=A0A2N1PLX1_9BACT|nr:MAG: agmatinase [Candidatus Wallbacteria bacterium HGW-Wallbacteria-1]